MPTEPEIKRVVAFIDGQALFFAARNVFGYHRANYDVVALSQSICKQQGWELAQTRFYTGVPSRSKDPTGSAFWTAKFIQMRCQGVHVFARELTYQERIDVLPDGRAETVFVPLEKGVDIRIALDIVRLAYEKAYDIALIFSQDQDLSEVVYDVEEISKQQIRWINFASAFPCSSEAKNKRGINRTSWIEIDRPTYDACIDPRDYFPKIIVEVKPETDEEHFWADLESNSNLLQRPYAEHILMLAKSRKYEIQWNIDRPRKWAVILYLHEENKFPIFLMSSNGVITIPVANKTVRKAIREQNIKVALLGKLNVIPGVSIPETEFRKDHDIPLEKLKHTDTIALFYEAIDWWTQEIKKSPVVVEEKAEKEAN